MASKKIAGRQGRLIKRCVRYSFVVAIQVALGCAAANAQQGMVGTTINIPTPATPATPATPTTPAAPTPNVPLIGTPTNVPGVTIVASPPPGFDPVNASPAERARYAVPPAPDATNAPQGYAHWRLMMTGLRNRQAPVVQQTNISHGPHRQVGNPVPQANGTSAVNSNNWSGASIVDSSNPFSSEVIFSYFTVPVARQAYGACTGGWDYSSLWVGIDGNGSNDVFQGGVEVDAFCSNGTTTPRYYAWIEWYPLNSVLVSSPTINAGDVVYVQAWNTSPTTGYIYFYNYSTGGSAQYGLTAPSGTQLVGNSIEWVVERPHRKRQPRHPAPLHLLGLAVRHRL